MTTIKELIENLKNYDENTLVAYQYYTEDHLKSMTGFEVLEDGHWDWAQLALENDETISDMSSYLDEAGEQI